MEVSNIVRAMQSATRKWSGNDLLNATEVATAGLNALTSKQLAALAEKQGFAIVPLEPTIEMETAAKDRNEDLAHSIHGTIYGGIYAAMVEAGKVKPQKPE